MNMKDSNPNMNTVWHEPTIYRHDRELMNGHKSAVVWFTGFSGAGKSTLSHALEDYLHKRQVRTYVLDGDNIRRGLCKDLGFDDDSREENIRRIGEVSKLMMEAGVLVLTAFISPFRKDRDIVRNMLREGEFLEIHVSAPLAVCEERDVKGLYAKARKGEIRNFTGISSPYEEPENPELVLDTNSNTVEDCVSSLIQLLKERELISFDYEP